MEIELNKKIYSECFIITDDDDPITHADVEAEIRSEPFMKCFKTGNDIFRQENREVADNRKSVRAGWESGRNPSILKPPLGEKKDCHNQK